ncbi:mannose-1-phosphate guanylyltransferase/mannose-6-phosphate isomerase [Lysobacter gummosus]|uniref:mannose-1-phosphate guanylyltransferase n=1 Tax=Lysobacter gummosus TaxID=262324 RepID=A0ABY3XD93_9GAMM|nr:mannose-1-phosphate guanylyltransferase/mannose-6-phosphate isomerase [Lysobacter gummosus]ALN93100.1 mannose-1-phosphate guanylyltransferase/mannose-6-phosphate isomerase [Lysobacter gummosus]UNP28611.1 mannose-1-phosphate guanylyltransferase/mannose-6-phosphate isomerase [Lysobacter gummosus]
MLHPVVLSGGSGSRLWPLSRQNQPKQFLSLIGDHSLFQETILRANALPNTGAPVTVCAEDHRFMVGEQLQGIGVANGAILLEPIARNTAPAIALAALHLVAGEPDATMLVLPADHLIEDVDAFRDAVARAAVLADQDWLVTFGIHPDYPETGYGYIDRGDALGEGGYKVSGFVEKPDLATAEGYLAAGTYAWNSGMFLFKAQRYLDELARLAPKILESARAAYAKANTDLDFIRLGKDEFAASPNDSIDYAVMEKTDRAAVVPVSCGWSDIGSWSSLWAVAERDDDGNRYEGDVISVDTTGSLVRASDRRMIATIGVEDLVIIDTPDATLVARKDRVQDVKTIVDKLKQAGRQEHLFHRKVYRPWGNYDSIDMGQRFQVKRIEVKPGGVLSLQKHHKRAEHWIVVSGVAEVTCDDKVFELRENESTYIPLGSVHRLRNRGTEPVELIEVQSGSYLGEDDIVRLEDVYGRS